MRGFLLGLILIVGLSLSILSLRPGGIRRQLRFAARRFRIMLILCGVFLIAAAANILASLLALVVLKPWRKKVVASAVAS